MNRARLASAKTGTYFSSSVPRQNGGRPSLCSPACVRLSENCAVGPGGIARPSSLDRTDRTSSSSSEAAPRLSWEARHVIAVILPVIFAKSSINTHPLPFPTASSSFQSRCMIVFKLEEPRVARKSSCGPTSASLKHIIGLVCYMLDWH